MGNDPEPVSVQTVRGAQAPRFMIRMPNLGFAYHLESRHFGAPSRSRDQFFVAATRAKRRDQAQPESPHSSE
jgi:hypothetical protein